MLGKKRQNEKYMPHNIATQILYSWSEKMIRHLHVQKSHPN
jgi:hypothetical protein